MPVLFAVFLYVLLACGVAALAIWILGQFAQDPVLKVGKVVIIVLLVVVMFWLVMNFIPFPSFPMGPRGRY